MKFSTSVSFPVYSLDGYLFKIFASFGSYFSKQSEDDSPYVFIFYVDVEIYLIRYFILGELERKDKKFTVR